MDITGDTFITYVNSRDRISGTDANFTYKIDFPANRTFNRVCVTRISIPKSYYIIAEPYNWFILREMGIDTKITVPPGNCGRKTFVRVVRDLLNQNSPHEWEYNIDYAGMNDIDDGKLTFTVSGNVFGGMDQQPSLVMGVGLFEQFGFHRNTTYDFENNRLRSLHQISFQAEDTLFLHSDMIKLDKRSVLQDIIAVNGVSFSNITWECPEIHANCKRLVSQSELVSFTLTDEDDYAINLNGQNMVFTLIFFNMRVGSFALPRPLAESDAIQSSLEEEKIN